MMTLSLLFLSLFTACGDKDETETAAAAEASTVDSTVVPADKASKSFSKLLFSNDFEGMRPVEGDGVKLTYNRLSFNPDGSWTAAGIVEIADEGMECMESGTWEMEPATADNVATMAWTLAETNCAGRESGGVVRAEMTLLDTGAYKMKMR